MPSKPKLRPVTVTIDGPGGVGKSTVAKLLAQRLGVMYLDTGATYRSLAYEAHRRGLNEVLDAKRIVSLARRLPLRLEPAAGGTLRVWLGADEVTEQIRTEKISEAAAVISQYPDVRAAMVRLQRGLADRHGVVVEGRDTGSVVFPQAAYKFFLDADPAVRARRRQRELQKRYGGEMPLRQVKEQLEYRDDLDRTRRVGPLIKPKGAVAINTSRLSAAQVVGRMLRHIAGRRGR